MNSIYRIKKWLGQQEAHFYLWISRLISVDSKLALSNSLEVRKSIYIDSVYILNPPYLYCDLSCMLVRLLRVFISFHSRKIWELYSVMNSDSSANHKANHKRADSISRNSVFWTFHVFIPFHRRTRWESHSVLNGYSSVNHNLNLKKCRFHTQQLSFFNISFLYVDIKGMHSIHIYA